MESTPIYGEGTLLYHPTQKKWIIVLDEGARKIPLMREPYKGAQEGARVYLRGIIYGEIFEGKIMEI